MRILVTGATGFIGRHIVNKLLELNYDVVACVRSGRSVPEAWHNIELIEVDFARDDRVSDWLERLKDVDVVINAVGIIKESAGQSFEAVHIKTPCALFEACAIAGVQKVIQISALGADADATSQYHLSKRAADDYLASQSYSWTILRPSIVYGAGAQSMALFKAISSLPFSPLIGDGAQQIQPIHIDDLVRIVVASIETDEGLNACIDLVGPEPISIEKMYTQLRRWLGLGRPRLLRVPYRLSLALSHLGGFVGGAPVTPETVQMLQRGNTADPGPLAERFGVTPKAFRLHWMKRRHNKRIAGTHSSTFSGRCCVTPWRSCGSRRDWCLRSVTRQKKVSPCWLSSVLPRPGLRCCSTARQSWMSF